jgi:serine/threonine protein kinase
MGKDFFSVEDGQPSIVSIPLSALPMLTDDIS